MDDEDIEELILYWHNKGEQDYPDNRDPPDKPTLLEFIEGNDELEIAISHAYRAGWRNAKGQAS